MELEVETDSEIERKKLAKKLEDVFANDVKKWLGTESGRRILKKLLEDTGIYRSSFRLNNEMTFLEGRRSVGLDWLLRVNEICPDNYIKLLEESKK